MLAPVALALPSFPLPWLIGGSVLGYLLVLWTNPVRTSLRDGLRCVRRYSSLWVTLGVFGFAYALFDLALRIYLFFALPPASRPTFMWARDGWRDPQFWLRGSPQSTWYLPPHSLHAIVRDSALSTLESVAGLFNLLATTFPLSAVAAVLLLINWEGHHTVLNRALRKRFGHWGWALHGGIVICALAALAKPFLYAAPQLLAGQPDAATLWFEWAPVVEWFSFLFEYLAGVCVQIGLVIIAFCWVRGIGFTQQHLIDFAIRRLSFVVRWALFVMLLSSAIIHVPLILKNFPAFQGLFPQDESTMDFRWKIARGVLTLGLLLCATMQITLIFHSESLGKAIRDHWRFVKQHWWPLAWFMIMAGLHFFFVRVGLETVQRGLGDNTALGIAWSLIVPWLNAFVAGWLLASWVCFYKHTDSARIAHEQALPEQGVLF